MINTKALKKNTNIQIKFEGIKMNEIIRLNSKKITFQTEVKTQPFPVPVGSPP